MKRSIIQKTVSEVIGPVHYQNTFEQHSNKISMKQVGRRGQEKIEDWRIKFHRSGIHKRMLKEIILSSRPTPPYGKRSLKQIKKWKTLFRLKNGTAGELLHKEEFSSSEIENNYRIINFESLNSFSKTIA